MVYSFTGGRVGAAVEPIDFNVSASGSGTLIRLPSFSEGLSLTIESETVFFADRIVKVIEVQRNATAKNHVSLVIAVAAVRPDIRPPLEPPADPSPPPSDLCIKTTLMRRSANIRCTVNMMLLIELAPVLSNYNFGSNGLKFF